MRASNAYVVSAFSDARDVSRGIAPETPGSPCQAYQPPSPGDGGCVLVNRRARRARREFLEFFSAVSAVSAVNVISSHALQADLFRSGFRLRRLAASADKKAGHYLLFSCELLASFQLEAGSRKL